MSILQQLLWLLIDFCGSLVRQGAKLYLCQRCRKNQLLVSAAAAHTALHPLFRGSSLVQAGWQTTEKKD